MKKIITLVVSILVIIFAISFTLREFGKTTTQQQISVSSNYSEHLLLNQQGKVKKEKIIKCKRLSSVNQPQAAPVHSIYTSPYTYDFLSTSRLAIRASIEPAAFSALKQTGHQQLFQTSREVDYKTNNYTQPAGVAFIAYTSKRDDSYASQQGFTSGLSGISQMNMNNLFRDLGENPDYAGKTTAPNNLANTPTEQLPVGSELTLLLLLAFLLFYKKTTLSE